MRYPKYRLLALMLFWLPVAYVTVAVFGSMMVELYSQKPLHQQGCMGRLIGLKTELERYWQIALKNPSTSDSKWLSRFLESQKVCGDQRVAYQQLFDVYQGYKRALTMIQQTRLEVQE